MQCVLIMPAIIVLVHVKKNLILYTLDMAGGNHVYR